MIFFLQTKLTSNNTIIIFLRVFIIKGGWKINSYIESQTILCEWKPYMEVKYYIW